MKIKLVQTCGACPEQYDAYLDGELLGYMRLRHGGFRVEYRGEVIYRGDPKGDGCFEDSERIKFLNIGCRAILEAHVKREEEQPIYEVEYEQQGTLD
jgi:hypothetical protein